MAGSGELAMTVQAHAPENPRRSALHREALTVTHPDLAANRHHHREGEAQARRLRRAAAEGAEERRRAGHGFLTYFVGQVVPHIRGEESLVFPLLVEDERGVLARLLVEHEHFYVLARRLAEALARGAPEAALLRQIGALLRAHIELEEQELYPVAERLAAPERDRPPSGQLPETRVFAGFSQRAWRRSTPPSGRLEGAPLP
jgi:Hemerythrin HHE cation binding domain